MVGFWFLLFFGIRPIFSLMEADLKKSLLSPVVYDPSVRPRINASHVVHVQLDIQVIYILGLEDREGKFSQALNLILTWTDEFLRWNTSEYDDVETFVTEPASIWTPDVTVYGKMDTNQGVDLSLVRVRSDGKVTTKFVGILSTHCIMNAAHFPFDYQLCYFYVGSDVYVTSEVVMETNVMEIYESAKINPSWDLIFVRFVNSTPGVCGVEYCLYRKSLYLGVLYMVPTSMHAILILMTYVVPSEVGERISFGMSLFLSFMVFLLQLNGDLPEISTSIPALEIFFMLHMSSGVVALVVAATTAYVTLNTTQTVSLGSVRDVSTVTSLNKKPLRSLCRCRCLKSASLLNRTGFVVSFTLILAANFVMLNATIVSDGCRIKD
uniref:Acetylcholine receptor subunit beta-type unc-29-like n=1 Tax=Crassostrea virginica TaxID=6565 RepID=A0A8B8DIY8_CRAVI|nr:acetylcholine receptor subunit beta-type unc-29-like [Crassostrea virginica]